MTALIAALVLASPSDQLGFTSAGSGLAGASLASPPGAALAYYNPSRAAFTRHVHAMVGYSDATPRLTLDDRRERVTGSRTLDLALVVPFDLGSWGDMGFSIALSVPTRWLIRATARPNDLARMLMYDNRMQRVEMDAALAWSDTFGPVRIGASAGVTGLGAATGSETSYEMTFKGEHTIAEGRLAAELPTVVTPMFSVSADWADWQFGAVFRAGGQFDFAFATFTAVDVDGIITDTYAALEAADFYTPPKLALGASWRFDALRVHAALEWHHWSGGPSLSSIYTIDADLDGRQVAVPSSPAATQSLLDVVIPRLGVEYTFEPAGWSVFLRAGASFETSPVGDLPGEAIFLDASRINTAAGLGIATPEPFYFLPHPASVDVHLLWQNVLPRTMNVAGRGEMELGGDMVAWGFTFTQRL